jgi:Icc-related predicted phosphoesterase
MKIVLISDTHNKHTNLFIPQGDMIMCAGDVSMRGKKEEIHTFLQWFSELPHTYKILIAGNHDRAFEQYPALCKKMIPENVIYLNDGGINIEGINIWGSPITPYFFDWAFNRYRGLHIQKHWEIIPEDTDILITHGPPLGYGDKLDPMFVRGGVTRVGCEDLLYHIEKIKPKLHVFGHIHEEGGFIKSNGDTLFINASSLDEYYWPRRTDPFVIHWDDIDKMIKDYE